MMTIMKTKQKISVEEARKKYINSKVIIILDENFDMSNLKGYVYAISNSNNSFEELCMESNTLRKKGIQNIIVGTYNNGGVVGVQHIM